MGAEIEGEYRKDVYELPISAIRELIANAVLHKAILINPVYRCVFMTTGWRFLHQVCLMADWARESMGFWKEDRYAKPGIPSILLMDIL